MQQTSVQKTKKTKEKLGGMNMFKKMKHIKNEKGLTLIELLADPAIGNIINNSKDKAILSEASNILSGAKLAHIDNSCGNADATTKVVTCTDTALKDFVDGITLDSTDKVTFDTVNKKWTIQFKEFEKIKDTDKYAAGFTGTTKTIATEEALNANLKK
jgi:type IV pilus assembly protein PilA